MKKTIIAICLCICLTIVFLAGCAGKKSNTEPSKAADENSGFSYTVNGVRLVPGDDFADAYKELGEPDNYTEAASCYFDGMDKVYTYTGYEVRTYPDGDKDIIQDICLSSKDFSTDKGITAGSSLDDVTAAYGNDYKLTGKMYKYYQSDTGYIYFFIMNDVVKYFGYAIDASN